MTPTYSALDTQADRPAIVIRAFPEWRDPEPPAAALARAIEVVCQTWGVTREEVVGRGRTERIAAPRLALYALMKRLTRVTSIELGRMLGKTHGAIIHGVKAAADRVDTDPHFAAAYRVAEARLGITP